MNAALATPNAALASRVGGIAAKSSVKQLRRASGLPAVAPLRTRNVVKAAASSEVRSEAHVRYRRDRDRGPSAVASRERARRRLVVSASRPSFLASSTRPRARVRRHVFRLPTR
jgi:hypothetical protein